MSYRQEIDKSDNAYTFRDQGPDKSRNSQLLEVVSAFRDFASEA